MPENLQLLFKRIIASAAFAVASIIIIQLLLFVLGQAPTIGKMTGPVGVSIAIALTIFWYPFVRRKLK
jgi:hypothetical protein